MATNNNIAAAAEQHKPQFGVLLHHGYACSKMEGVRLGGFEPQSHCSSLQFFLY